MKKIDDALDEATKQISAVYRFFYPYCESDSITLKKELYHLLLGLDKTNGAVVDALVQDENIRSAVSYPTLLGKESTAEALQSDIGSLTDAFRLEFGDNLKKGGSLCGFYSAYCFS